MKIKKGKTFLELVHKEAVALKKNATKEELDKLDFEHLDAGTRGDCIYGQMTGSCNSKRAYDLMVIGCERVLTRGKRVNGPITSPRIYFSWFSPIEAYISRLDDWGDILGTAPRAEKLIDFLQGRTETFKP